MKKILISLLIVAMLMTFAGCGGGNKKDLVGVWKITDTATETEYGLGIQFAKNGKLRYGLTEDMFASLAGKDPSDKDFEDAMKGLDLLMNMEYDVINDTEIEVTMSALFGLAKESVTVSYQLDGDTLVFDGATYTRVK